MNYSRQFDAFDAETFNDQVHVIGAGATGSWVALLLAKLGVKNLHIWDFDKIEEHNLPNQAFNFGQIGEYKAEAITSNILSMVEETNIKYHNERVDKNTRLSGYVFMLTDTMSSRKELYENVFKFNPAIKLFIETRMALDGGIIYSVNPMNIEELDKYQGTLFDDDNSETSACGASKSIVTTAVAISSMAIWQMLNHVNKDEVTFEMFLSTRYPSVYIPKKR